MRRFSDFYSYYVSQHQHPMCRALRYVGSSLVLLFIALAISLGNVCLLLLLPIVGYAPAWLGHYVFEHNRPATFTHPIYSFLADVYAVGNRVIQV